MAWIAWRCHKIEVLVKRPRFLILRVNNKSANPGDIRGSQRARHRVLRKAGTKSLALPRGGDRQPGEQYDWKRMTRQPLFQALRGIVVLDLAGNLRAGEGNIRLRSSALLALKRMADQKAIQRLRSEMAESCPAPLPSALAFPESPRLPIVTMDFK